MPMIEAAPGVSIQYETFGDPADPAVLLVMGFSAQMIAWHEEFCRALAERGRYVIRYDNRDCGLSTKFDEHPVDTGRLISTVSSGDIASALAMVPYTLTDMADDGLGLLTALGVERAHVVGSSMGGMIAQTMAVNQPARVLTLTSMMSSTGEPDYGRSSAEAQAVLSSPKPPDREGYVAAAEKELTWASKRYGNPAPFRELAADSYDRAYYPAGAGRQLGAMILMRLTRRRTPQASSADPGDPWPGRHADRPQRRKAHGRPDPRSGTPAAPRHGARPSARALAGDHRRLGRAHPLSSPSPRTSRSRGHLGLQSCLHTERSVHRRVADTSADHVIGTASRKSCRTEPRWRRVPVSAGWSKATRRFLTGG